MLATPASSTLLRYPGTILTTSLLVSFGNIVGRTAVGEIAQGCGGDGGAGQGEGQRLAGKGREHAAPLPVHHIVEPLVAGVTPPHQSISIINCWINGAGVNGNERENVLALLLEDLADDRRNATGHGQHSGDLTVL